MLKVSRGINTNRTTMRIAWLLLSLSTLLHSVCSDSTSSPLPAEAGLLATTGGNTSKTELTEDIKKSLAEANTTAAVSMIVMTVANPTAVPQSYAKTQPQSSPINNPSSTNVNIFTSPAGTFSNPKATIPATTAASATTVTTVLTGTVTGSDGLLALPSTVKVQTPAAVVSSELPRTKPSDMQTEQPQHVGVLNITKVSTYATVRQQPMTHPTTASEISKGDTDRTVTATRNGQATSRATQPAGNPEATNIHPTLITTGSLVPEITSGTISLKTTPSMKKRFQYTLNNKQETEKDKVLVEVCKRLMANLQDGNCILIWNHQNGKVQFESVEINGKVKTSLTTQYYEEISKKPADNKTLIAILASCGALLIMIFILAVCASHHRRPYSENQQHLTEELHTVENGYHDNPTLEVMEVQPEMQEKKVALNGEFSDSWIVPIDNLLKEDIPDEEDTHL